MFLLVSVRHVGGHIGEHQHGVSIQISISLGKTFLRISRIRNIPMYMYLLSFPRFWTLSIFFSFSFFFLIYFEWRDTENQQLGKQNIEA